LLAHMGGRFWPRAATGQFRATMAASDPLQPVAIIEVRP
jgi:hypothetical protein